MQLVESLAQIITKLSEEILNVKSDNFALKL
jgi:hypothetical protein